MENNVIEKRQEPAGEDEYGDPRVKFIEVSREDCAVLTKRNGAWLVQLFGSLTDDLLPWELFSCAGALGTAKRVAKAMAVGIGYEPAWRWTQELGGSSWTLSGKVVNERVGSPE